MVPRRPLIHDTWISAMSDNKGMVNHDKEKKRNPMSRRSNKLQKYGEVV